MSPTGVLVHEPGEVIGPAVDPPEAITRLAPAVLVLIDAGPQVVRTGGGGARQRGLLAPGGGGGGGGQLTTEACLHSRTCVACGEPSSVRLSCLRGGWVIERGGLSKSYLLR